MFVTEEPYLYHSEAIFVTAAEQEQVEISVNFDQYLSSCSHSQLNSHHQSLASFIRQSAGGVRNSA